MSSKGNCKKCAGYKAYYYRGFFKFWIQKSGLCTESGKAVGEKDGCGLWRPCGKQTATIEILDKAIEDVDVLKQIYGVG